MLIKGQRWVVEGVVLKVHDEAECPICKSIDEVREVASFHQSALLKECLDIHWSMLNCARCGKMYMYRSEWSEERDAERSDHIS